VISFKNFYLESNVAGDGGVFGDYESQVDLFNNKDSYAPGSAIVPTFLGAYTRGGKIKIKPKRRIKRKKR